MYPTLPAVDSCELGPKSVANLVYLPTMGSDPLIAFWPR